jgi:hypothetical protein
VPACAIGCLAASGPALLRASISDPFPSEGEHEFDRDYGPLTLRQYFERQLGSGARVLKGIETEIGEDQLLRALHSYSIKEGRARGQKFVQRYPGRDFHSYNERFRSGEMEGLITYEILEDSESAFEIRVTECVLVEPMLQEDAGKIGNAWLCDMDFSHAQGYDPRIKLVRDKTLMKGDSCCNHRYLWTDERG